MQRDPDKLPASAKASGLVWHRGDAISATDVAAAARDAAVIVHAVNPRASVLIVRAGDFFGPNAANNWFSQGLVKPGKTIRVITYPGRRGIGHQWAYLPDVAQTMVQLLEEPEALEKFACAQMIDAVRRVACNPKIKVRPMPWWLVRWLSPIVLLFRELSEMRYLWDVPLRMDNNRLRAVLGSEPHTPLDEAVRNTLFGLGCLASAIPPVPVGLNK